jgi:GNAT superfamily N-acetyltransferase
MYEVACEAYPDVPGESEEEMAPFEEWLSRDLQGFGDPPEATFIALAGDEVVGYAKFSISNARPGVAHHDMTGVLRSWRRRGIAGALNRAEIRWAKENGYTRLETGNEHRNEPIRRFNERHGYWPEPGTIELRGPVGPGLPSHRLCDKLRVRPRTKRGNTRKGGADGSRSRVQAQWPKGDRRELLQGSVDDGCHP